MGYTKTQRNSYGGWIEKREGGYYLIIMGGYSYRLHFNSRGNVKIAEMHWTFIIVVSYLACNRKKSLQKYFSEAFLFAFKKLLPVNCRK